MRRSARDDKNATESEQQSEEQNNDYEKDRKIKRLTQINRQLIDTLKQQNEELTKKIQKQKLRGAKSSHKSAPKNNKQLESIRKQLSNAYKQIDMYKQIIQNLKAKEVSLDHVDKIKQLENRVKEEDTIIENYQKEIKYLTGLKEKQDKDLKVFDNEEVKQNKVILEKEINAMKEKIKTLKKTATKREEIEKRQHAYFVQLEKSLRKMNDEYYPGKQEPKKQRDQEEVLEKDWTNIKNKMTELRRIYDENNKKLDTISRQKLRQLKSYQENELKLKEKMRKLNMLRSRIAQLTKLTVLKEQPKEPKQQPVLTKRQEVKNDKNIVEREVKKWNVPESFCIQQGKVLPNSSFASDKQILSDQHKYKIKQANVYVNGSGAPCLLNFIYQNQDGEQIDGKDMVENIPQNLDIKNFSLKEKDYISRISGSFKQGLLNSITFRSKLGSEVTFQDENSKIGGEMFNFHRQANDIPSCFYGATILTNPNLNQIKICYLGFQFNRDW